MKATIGVVFYSSSAVVVGSIVMVEAALVSFAIAQGAALGADTPISGITIGFILVGGFAALIAAVKGSKYLIELGMTIQKWIEALNANVALVEQVSALSKEVAALQRWRAAVDPILTEWQRRNGVMTRDDAQSA